MNETKHQIIVMQTNWPPQLCGGGPLKILHLFSFFLFALWVCARLIATCQFDFISQFIDEIWCEIIYIKVSNAAFWRDKLNSFILCILTWQSVKSKQQSLRPSEGEKVLFLVLRSEKHDCLFISVWGTREIAAVF